MSRKKHVVSLTDDQRAALDERDRGPLTRRERNRFAAGGLDPALTEKARPGAAPLLDGKAEAVVIALACSPAPDGRATWTARMLANKLVELEVVGSVSEDTILRVLKKAPSSRGRRRAGASPRG
jgi:hypothetical protein